VFARYPTIPVRFLQDSLKGQQQPPPFVTSRTDGLKEPAEFWAALGGRLRPSLSASVTIGIEVFAADEPVPLVTGDPPVEIRIVQRPSIGGVVLAADGAAVAGAVALVEAGLSTTTGAGGRYTIGPVTPGSYTLRAQSGAAVGTVTITVPRPARSPPGGYDLRLGAAPPRSRRSPGTGPSP
jgi:hypothetical protein